MAVACEECLNEDYPTVRPRYRLKGKRGIRICPVWKFEPQIMDADLGYILELSVSMCKGNPSNFAFISVEYVDGENVMPLTIPFRKTNNGIELVNVCRIGVKLGRFYNNILTS